MHDQAHGSRECRMTRFELSQRCRWSSPAALCFYKDFSAPSATEEGGKVVGVLAPANAERTHSGRGYVQNLDGRFSGEADMQMSGMLYGPRLLAHVDFPAPEVLGPGAREDDIQGLIDRHKTIFIKPQFKGGVGKKSKAGLIGTACDLKTALQQKERLYFAEHRDGLV